MQVSHVHETTCLICRLLTWIKHWHFFEISRSGGHLVRVLLKVLDAVIIKTLDFRYTRPPRQILRFLEDLLVERVKL